MNGRAGADMGRISLYTHTLRHLTFWQVAGRLLAAVKRKSGLHPLPAAPDGLRGALHPAVPMPVHDPWNTREALLEGRFTFLEETRDLGRPVDWEAAAEPLLWRFNLHYFHYFHLLAPEEQEALGLDWVARHGTPDGVGWHPYPTSLRIVNWCRAGVHHPHLLESLYRQAGHLYRNQETYVMGNHLLENARALVVAGSFFDGHGNGHGNGYGEAGRWLDRGLALYRSETPRQILPDGSHFERSPMYHALMLEGYLDALNVLPEGHPQRAPLLDTARRMLTVLASMRHPDGRLPLLNDATHEIAASPDMLLDYADRLGMPAPALRDVFPDAGYYIHSNPALFLVVDGGPVGPDHLMAHAHADIFSYELSLYGSPVVVDSGVYEYPAGPMRAYVRSTKAHNTVTVDDADQVECWSSFRVARRDAPRDVAVHRENGTGRFTGRFDGYAALIGDGIRHRRTLTWDDGARTVRVRDEVEGRGRHRVASRIHFHPDTILEGEEGSVRIRVPGGACQLRVDAGSLAWESGWYCPRFGVRIENRVAVVEGGATLPATCAYTLEYEPL